MANNNPDNQSAPYIGNPLIPSNILSANPNPLPTINHGTCLQPDQSIYGSGVSACPHRSKEDQSSIPLEAKSGMQENAIPNLPEVPVAVPPDHNESNFSNAPLIGSIEELKNKANFSAKSGEHKESIEHFKSLIENNPDDGSLWTLLGHCYLLDEKHQDAFNSYQKALNLLPDIKHPQLWYGIGLLYEKVSIGNNNSSKRMNMLYQHICVY